MCLLYGPGTCKLGREYLDTWEDKTRTCGRGFSAFVVLSFCYPRCLILEKLFEDDVPRRPDVNTIQYDSTRGTRAMFTFTYFDARPLFFPSSQVHFLAALSIPRVVVHSKVLFLAVVLLHLYCCTVQQVSRPTAETMREHPGFGALDSNARYWCIPFYLFPFRRLRGPVCTFQYHARHYTGTNLPILVRAVLTASFCSTRRVRHGTVCPSTKYLKNNSWPVRTDSPLLKGWCSSADRTVVAGGKGIPVPIVLLGHIHKKNCLGLCNGRVISR